MKPVNPLKLDLRQIASIKARARRKNASGRLDYLRARIRRELEQRWAQDQSDSSQPSRVLLLDFDGEHPHLGAAHIQLISFFKDNFLAHDTDDFDGFVIGLPLAWLPLDAVLAEALRVLRPGGRLLFCTFGPDTLQQLRWAWSEVDELPHVHPFIDMHHIGDELLRCGFVRPIVDVDRVAVAYPNAAMLYADLRGEGFTNLLAERRKTLTGAARFAGFAKALDSLRQPGAPLSITFELIYGVATAPLPSSQVRVAPPEMI